MFFSSFAISISKKLHLLVTILVQSCILQLEIIRMSSSGLKKFKLIIFCLLSRSAIRFWGCVDRNITFRTRAFSSLYFFHFFSKLLYILATVLSFIFKLQKVVLIGKIRSSLCAFWQVAYCTCTTYKVAKHLFRRGSFDWVKGGGVSCYCVSLVWFLIFCIMGSPKCPPLT